MLNYVKKPVLAFLQDVSLKNKLLLSYFILIVLPLGVITYLSYQKSSRIVEENMIKIASQSMEQAATSLADRLGNGVNVSNIIAFNNDIQKILSKKPEGYTKYEQAEDVTKIRGIVGSPQDGQNIYRIRVYVNAAFDYSGENNNIFSVRDITGTAWYQRALEYDGKVLWLNSHLFKYAGLEDEKEIISAVRLIKDYMHTGEILGLVCTDIPAGQFAELLRKYNPSEQGLLYVVDQAYNDVFGLNEGITNAGLKEAAAAVPGMKSLQDWTELKLAGKSYLVCKKPIGNSEWKMISIIPFDEMLASSRSIRNYSYLLMVFAGLASYLLAYLISLSMSRRLGKLIQVMRKAKKGELSTPVSVEGKDEIGELQEDFSTMLQRIAGLLEEKYRMGQELKNAELKALQAQINPHFLYNTLELIHWKAVKQKAYDISFLVNALADFYKLSLSKGRTVVSIAQEIEHVELYIRIQNKRFKDAVIFEKDIDDKVLAYSIPKLVLQPLVENSIMHGILEKEDPTGTIMITGRLDGDRIILEVCDDGVGIGTEELEGLMLAGKSSGEHGYGVGNVDKRLKMYYGEQYGLTYKSVRGSGTMVEIRIPALR